MGPAKEVNVVFPALLGPNLTLWCPELLWVSLLGPLDRQSQEEFVKMH